MSTGLKRTWRTGDTWRNVAYTYFRESGQWRYLLELNSSFDIRYVPAPGVEVQISGEVGLGKSTPRLSSTPGTLQQVDTNLDLRGGTQPSSADEAPGIFPWDSYGEYAQRLGDYTAGALLGPDRTNGFSLDSPQASSETQRG